MAKRKVLNALNGWKSLSLEGAFTSEDLDGLIGIEELTDYNDTISGETKSKKAKILKNKKKETNVEESSSGKFVKSPKLRKLIVKQNVELSGQFVRNPNILNNNENNAHKNNLKKKKKNKVELGILTNDAFEKKNIDDLKAWSIAPLPEPLLQALADLGFETPTQIQELTLPPAILGRRDILGAAETGSGKTLAFGLPILSGIIRLKSESSLNETNFDSVDKTDGNSENDDFESENEDSGEDLNENGLGLVKSINNIEFPSVVVKKPFKPLYALILTPTRELAIQVQNHLKSIAKYTDIKIAVILGGMSAEKQERILKKGPEIVVATPGRLWELLQQKDSHLSQIDSIKYLAIDETDRMLERGHFQEFHQLLERLNTDESKKKERQNFVFSATLTLVHDLPHHLAMKKKLKARYSIKILKLTPGQKLQKIIAMLGITDPKIVDVTNETGTASSLTECKINCNIEEKDYYVYYFLQRHPGRTLIFCNSIGCVKRLSSLLNLLACHALPLHAAMQQRQRLKNLERFRDNPLGVLVATDVAARGLDIPKVDHVLHYQIPRTSESYVHRSGRTARASQIGITVLLIEPNEITNYLQLCRNLGRNQDIAMFPISQNHLNAVKHRVNLARDLDRVELQMKRVNMEHGWLQKAAHEMDIIIDDEKLAVAKDDEQTAKWKRQTNAKRRELMALLEKKIFPKGFSSKYPMSCDQMDISFMESIQANQKAVDVMKSALNDNANKTKRKNKNKIHKKKTKIIK